MNLNDNSCEDQDTIESQPRGISEASLATVWEGVVRGLHDVDYWEFVESWDP